MSIHVALNHVTHYRYDRPVTLSPQVVRLRPAAHSRTRILSYSLKVEPAQHFINWQQDPQNNYLARLVFPDKTTEFKVSVDLVAEMAVFNPFDFFLEPVAENVPFQYGAEAYEELAPFLVKAPATPEFTKYAASISREKTRTIDFLVALNQRLSQDIQYLIRMEPGVQTSEETLTKGSGSCRDSAWLLVQLLRDYGLAARFVSGYLIQLAPDVKSIDGPSGPEKDFTDLHAWVEVYLPGAGWIGLDPTSGLLAGEGHIPLACSPEPSSAAPISGAVDESEVSFEHHMQVQRIFESPRMSKPYSEDQWAAIEAMGHQVDADLNAMDVRLTMGGEPTFVSDTDRDGEEWNTSAMGPTKRGYGTELLQRLATKYGKGGFFHFGQGKWYPGEQLPRWALSLYWRADGEPIWSDPTRFADERIPQANTDKDAQVFLASLTKRLGLDPQWMIPGYEDVFYYLWRERKLPANVDPFDSKLEDPHARAMLRKVFDQGLKKVVGYCLPLERDRHGKPTWRTGPWFMRDERMYLFPGESPMGYRLPLDSLPWVSKAEYPYLNPVDPFSQEAQKPLLSRQEYEARQRLVGKNPSTRDIERPLLVRQSTTAASGAGGLGHAGHQDDNTASAAPSDIARTALCVEPRNGILYVFLPPLVYLDDYLELLSAVEVTAKEQGKSIVLEGYPPPRDARLKVLAITPDPGVLEVNIHPAHNWAELVENTEFLYEAARQSRLSTEKFMVDGRHTGTGGGNHFVLGGATPADSPFLRRPDVLASLIRFWINHPSLSYLFSGLFIGPTSQAPRVDEARSDQILELELAFKEVKRQFDRKDCPPWIIDRILRNLLIDVTGNTHRSEFCIDKLYSPDGPTGRLGLLELRAFEMPPHARMSLAQQLLLRSLLAAFWKTPYERPLVRWGTELHDRFMLPSFIAMDFEGVLDELGLMGYEMDRHWFDPHFEFRFPVIGDLAVQGMTLNLRNALEPWHVMGEEGAAGGNVRYVDSSLERLEIKVTGYVDQRYRITCNGVTVPLQPTGRIGEYVAGIRYRAWQPSSCLHPTVGVDAPLTFDVIDTWTQRSLGGGQYHVAHPGGRNYDTFPVNGFEAESRRLSRFFRMGHSQGQQSAPVHKKSLEHPFTLDLRMIE